MRRDVPRARDVGVAVTPRARETHEGHDDDAIDATPHTRAEGRDRWEKKINDRSRRADDRSTDDGRRRTTRANDARAPTWASHRVTPTRDGDARWMRDVARLWGGEDGLF
jgi:hypothetical protein